MAPRMNKRKAAEEHLVLAKKNKRSVRVTPSESSLLPFEQSDDHGSTHSVWLDALPQDICVRIAAYVTHDRGDSRHPELLNEDALALAETSAKQRDIMAESLDHTPDLQYGDLKRWLDVFKYPACIDAREGRGNAVLQFLARSSLRVAHISNRGNHLTAIAQGNAVVDLSIHLERLTEARYTTMLEALQKLAHLVSLSIRCDPVQTCAFECIIDSQNAYNRLSQACPRLTALHMCCHCRTEVDHSPVVEAFPSLREITVTRPLPDAALEYLRSRESVILQSYSRPLCRYASEIGNAVTAIKFPDPKWSFDDPGDIPYWMDSANGEEVALLKKCPRLRKVDLLLSPGAEKELPQMKQLLSLQLHWSIKDRENEDSVWLDRSLDGSMVRCLYAQPLLHTVALVGAPVQMVDLATVLRTINSSLEKLTVSLTGQPDVATDRLLAIMNIVIQYNDKLQMLRVVEPLFVEWTERRKCLSGVSIEKRKEFVPEFYGRLRRLKRRNPWFDSRTLLASTDYFVTECEEVMAR